MEDEFETMASTDIKTKEVNIVEVVATSAMSSYGIVAFAKKTNKKGIQEDDITVKKNRNGSMTIALHILVASDVKITEVVRSCQKTVKNKLDKLFPKVDKTIDVIVEDILER